MSNYNFTATNKKTGKVVDVYAMDDHFGRHRYGYKTGNHILTENEFDLAYTVNKDSTSSVDTPPKEPDATCIICGLETEPNMLCKCTERQSDGSWVSSTPPTYYQGGSSLTVKMDKQLDNDFTPPPTDRQKKIEAGAKDFAERFDNTATPYSKIDHSHCWTKDKPPCGQRIEHYKCCLCELLNPKISALLTKDKGE